MPSLLAELEHRHSEDRKELERRHLEDRKELERRHLEDRRKLFEKVIARHSNNEAAARAKKKK